MTDGRDEGLRTSALMLLRKLWRLPDAALLLVLFDDLGQPMFGGSNMTTMEDVEDDGTLFLQVLEVRGLLGTSSAHTRHRSSAWRNNRLTHEHCGGTVDVGREVRGTLRDQACRVTRST